MNNIIDYNNMREKFGQSFTEFIEGKYDEPEKTDRWTGYVIDNKDPERRGRVKVLIIGKYDNIPEIAIPWAIPDISYLGSKAGNFIVPETGTILRGYFDHDDIQKPIFDSVAFNIDNSNKSIIDIRNRSDYPHKMILMQTDQGECLTLNRSNGIVEFKHRSGASITIHSNGSIDIIAGNNNEKSDPEINILSDSGMINVSTDSGNIEIHSNTGDVNINSEFGQVNLGNNMVKQLVNNLPTCLVTGAPHFVGNTNVKC